MLGAVFASKRLVRNIFSINKNRANIKENMLFTNFIKKVKKLQKTYCKIVNNEVYVGKKQMAEVVIGDSLYYIPKSRISNLRKNESFYFACARKDLIQVDDVIHADYLYE